MRHQHFAANDERHPRIGVGRRSLHIGAVGPAGGHVGPIVCDAPVVADRVAGQFGHRSDGEHTDAGDGADFHRCWVSSCGFTCAS